MDETWNVLSEQYIEVMKKNKDCCSFPRCFIEHAPASLQGSIDQPESLRAHAEADSA